MGRSKNLIGMRVMVDAKALETLLTAVHNAADGDASEINNILRYYRDVANPARVLTNQYNDTLNLLATPPDGEA